MKLIRYGIFSLIILFPVLLLARDINETDIEDAIYIKKASRKMVFKNIYVFPADTRKDKLLGNLIYDYVRKKLVSLKRFNVYSNAKLSSELLKTGLMHVDISDRKELLRMSDTLDIDGYIEPGIIRNNQQINIELRLLDRGGKVFAIEGVENFIYRDKEPLNKVVSDLLKRLIDKIPYSGLITGLKKDLIYLDVGKKDNLKQNDVLRIFEIDSVKRHPVLGFIVDVKKTSVGRVVLIDVKEASSVAKLRAIKSGKSFRINMKVDKRPLAKDPFLYPEPTKTFKSDNANRRYESTFGNFEVRLIVGMFRHTSSSDNADMNTSVNALPYPELQLLSNLWITSRWAMEAIIQGGIVPVKDSTLSPSSITASVSKIALLGKYRILIGKTFSDPVIFPLFGIYRYSFMPDKTDPLKLTKKTYYGVSAGFEIHVPLNDRFLLKARGIIHPFARLNEAPQTSGEGNSSSGYDFEAGIRYKLKERVDLTGGIKVDYYGSNFSGDSERGTPNANSSITSIGLFGGMSVSF